MAVIRITGNLARLDLRDQLNRHLAWPSSGKVRIGRLMQGPQHVDHVLTVGGPNGADLHVHGGPAVLEAVAGCLAAGGLGESPAAERVSPHCLRHARALLSAASGPLSRLRGAAEAAMKVGFVSDRLASEIHRSLALEAFAAVLTNPPSVSVVGLPNAGKSLLFNALLGEQRSLVSPEEGTTRDTVGARMLVRQVPIVLHDTAGVEHGQSAGATGHAVIHLLSDPAEPPWLAPATLAVLGRADERTAHGALPMVSGLTGQGVEGLLDRLADALGIPASAEADLWAPLDEDLRWTLRETLGCASAKQRG